MDDAKQNGGPGAEPKAGISGWFQELRRRHIFKVTVAYLVLAWLLMQVASVLESSLNLPAWTDTLTFVILLIGFPIALILTWAVDLTPARSSRETGASPGPSSEFKRGLDSNQEKLLISSESGQQRASIAVLPFSNISGNSDQDYLGDGIAAEVIAGLSRLRAFFVISRNSTFQYRGKNEDIRKIAKDLNVKYVLEGTVQRIGDRLRLNVELIDGEKGFQIWSDIYDRDFADLFKIQEELTVAIIGQLGTELTRAEYERTRTRRPEDLNTWELFHRAMGLIVKRTKGSSEEARNLLARAINLDKGFALGYAALSWSMSIDTLFRLFEHKREETLKLARKAVDFDQTEPFCWLSFAWALYYSGQPDESIRACRKAIELNPSFAHAHASLSRALVQTGSIDEGLRHAEIACELSPKDPNKGMWIHMLATGNLYKGNYASAINFGREAIQLLDTWLPRMIITSALGHLGDASGAALAFSETQRRKPNFSLDQVRREYVVFDDNCRELLLDGLRRASVPETAEQNPTVQVQKKSV